MPAGFSGEALVQGALGTAGQMFGGQDTLDAAARMVRGAAPGADMTPQGQAAIGVIQQMFDRYGQLSGQPHPAVAATTAAKQTAAGGGVTTPVTTTGVSPLTVTRPNTAQTQQVSGFNQFGPVMGTPGTGSAANAFTAPVTTPATPQAFAQSGVPEGSARGAAPTVVLNF